MNISPISNNTYFRGGATIYLNSFTDGYRNGVDREQKNPGDLYDKYNTTWERTLSQAAYEKGYQEGESEQGKSIYDLKYRSIYEGTRPEYIKNHYCPRAAMDVAEGELVMDCVSCDADGSYCSYEAPKNISDEAMQLAIKEGIYIPDAQNYLEITDNDNA